MTGSSNRKRPTVPFDQTGGEAWLYTTAVGRLLLKLLTRPFVSRLAGAVMDSPLSAPAVARFVRRHGIDLTLYESEHYRSYNAFFTRRIRPEHRPIAPPPHLVSPCDCKLSVYPIDGDRRFFIKGSPYSVSELLGGDPLAAAYDGGWCLICRLAVDDYHRYCYIDDGEKGGNVSIPGALHTVRPIALDHVNIYKRNTREYTVLHTAHFGDVVQVEVGALMVGRICNHRQAGMFRRGEEKGYFAFGGSTIVLLFRRGTVIPDEELVDNTEKGLETVVRMGETCGVCAHP